MSMRVGLVAEGAGLVAADLQYRFDGLPVLDRGGKLRFVDHGWHRLEYGQPDSAGTGYRVLRITTNPGVPPA